MAEENFKKSLKLKSHTAKKEDHPHHHHDHHHQKQPRDSDVLKSHPTKVKEEQESTKSPKNSPSPQVTTVNAKKTKETGTVSLKKQSDDVKFKSVTKIVKDEVNTSAGNSSRVKEEVSVKAKKKISTSNGKEKAEKKVYILPGQRHDPPEERDPLRIFYESLYEQIPTSEMAAIWMMEHGLLPAEKARKVYEKKQKRQQQQKTGTPVKSSSVNETYGNSDKNGDFNDIIKSKSKKNLSFEDDDDFVLKPKKKKMS